MNDVLAVALTCLAGGSLGVIFFAGLRWTVRRGLVSRQPALWFLGSFVVRAGIVATGFYFVGGNRWERLLACLAGFVLARWVLTAQNREASHAP